MSLTVEEASAVNQLLRFVLGIPRPGQALVGSADARDAGALLADHAHRKLMAGLTAADVREKWGPT